MYIIYYDLLNHNLGQNHRPICTYIYKYIYIYTHRKMETKREISFEKAFSQEVGPRPFQEEPLDMRSSRETLPRAVYRGRCCDTLRRQQPRGRVEERCSHGQEARHRHWENRSPLREGCCSCRKGRPTFPREAAKSLSSCLEEMMLAESWPSSRKRSCWEDLLSKRAFFLPRGRAHRELLEVGPPHLFLCFLPFTYLGLFFLLLHFYSP